MTAPTLTNDQRWTRRAQAQSRAERRARAERAERRAMTDPRAW